MYFQHFHHSSSNILPLTFVKNSLPTKREDFCMCLFVSSVQSPIRIGSKQACCGRLISKPKKSSRGHPSPFKPLGAILPAYVTEGRCLLPSVAFLLPLRKVLFSQLPLSKKKQRRQGCYCPVTLYVVIFVPSSKERRKGEPDREETSCSLLCASPLKFKGCLSTLPCFT